MVKVSRLYLVVVSVGCIYALYISLLSFAVLTFGGKPVQIVSVNAWIFDRYLLAIMFFPFCLFAFVPRWWSTIPLWISCIWVAFFPLFLSGEAANKWGHPLGFMGRDRAVEIACIVLLPALVQIAKMGRSVDRPTTQGALL